MPKSRPRQAPKHYPRVARVNEVVMEALAEELERLSDPRLGFVTLTGVEVTTDLQLRRRLLLGPRDRRGPQRDRGRTRPPPGPRLRSVLARHVRMKHLPELRFREDPSVEGGQRIDSILRDLHPDGDRADDAGDRRRNEGER